ncbi:MAG: efflux RND transporter periplasmic adaptor subunit [Saprospiraceae bacterium]|nr:efflux RND transporter periplasmic adaptor subunit [Saprospiraceae bacterium]
MKKTQNQLILLAFLGLMACSSSADKGTEMAIPVPPTRAMGVDVFLAKEQLLENIINATGSLLPNEAVQIAPEKAGKLVELHFDESSYVKE